MNSNVNPNDNGFNQGTSINNVPNGSNVSNVNSQPVIQTGASSNVVNPQGGSANSVTNVSAGVQTGVSNNPVLINTVTNSSGNESVGNGTINNMVADTGINVNPNANPSAPGVTNNMNDVSNTSTTTNSSNQESNIPGMSNNSIVDNIIAANNASKKKKELKEVQIDYKPPSKLKYTMLIIVFIAMLLMVWFLPEISSYIDIMKSGKDKTEEKITTGTLKCKMSRSSNNYDFNYQQDFAFKDNKLSKLYYTIETRGDMNLDKEDLNTMNKKCKMLSSMAKQLQGITVSCDLRQGTMTEEHVFSYAELDVDAVTAAYTEAGGVYPEYHNEQDIDAIEKNKNAEGFTCQRIK